MWWKKAIERKMKWTSVKDRLPDEFKGYQTYAPDLFDDLEMQDVEKQAIVAWTEHGWEFYEDLITHWMPLPEPPE